MKHVPTLVVISCLAIAGCDRDKPAAPSQTVAKPSAVAYAPGDVVLKYYEFMSSAKFEDAYRLVNSADRAARSLDDFVSSASNPLQAAILKRQTYLVTTTDVDGESAKVMVDTTSPDIAQLQRLVLKDWSAGHQTPPTADDMKAKILERLAQAEVPTVLTHQAVYLKKEAGAWLMDFDWDKEHAQREVPTPVRTDADAGNGAD